MAHVVKSPPTNPQCMTLVLTPSHLRREVCNPNIFLPTQLIAHCIASPRNDRFLPSYGKSMFCHTCQTNQVPPLYPELFGLILNVPFPGVADEPSCKLPPSPRSSSLSILVHFPLNPPTQDPEYSTRLASLPSYRASVELRYPPVCADCLPAVEEEIRSRDHMARTSALGHWLKFSKGKGKERVANGDLYSSGKGKSRSTTVMGVKKVKRNVQIWLLRGGIWITALGVSLGVDVVGQVSSMEIYPPTPKLNVPFRLHLWLANIRRKCFALQSRPNSGDGVLSCRTHLESVGELCE